MALVYGARLLLGMTAKLATFAFFAVVTVLLFVAADWMCHVLHLPCGDF